MNKNIFFYFLILPFFISCGNNANPKEVFQTAKNEFFEKEFTKSAALFSEYCKAQPDDFDGKLWLVRSLIFSENYSEAESLINKMILTNKEDWRLYFWNAQQKKLTGNFEEYFSYLRKAEAILKDSAAVYKELSFIWETLGLHDRSSVCKNKMEVLAQ